MSTTTRERQSLPSPDFNLPPRPNTTMRRKKPVRTNVKLLISGGNFGKDAPKFTIPSSRKDDLPPIPLPGPGEYEISNLDSRKLKPVFPKSRPQTVIISPTANVDFVNIRPFPEVKDFHILNRNKFEYFDIIETPGPSYVPNDPVTRIQHTISPKPKERNVEKIAHLGPGSYNLKFPYIPREPAYNFYGPRKRDDWMVDRQHNPGPGHYNPNEVKKSEPKWTIGRKSRLSRRAKSMNSKNQKNIIAVDQCIVRLDELSNPDAARQYIMTHPILREIVREILDIVLLEKPDDPIALIEDYFTDIKRKQTPKKKKERNIS